MSFYCKNVYAINISDKNAGADPWERLGRSPPTRPIGYHFYSAPHCYRLVLRLSVRHVPVLCPNEWRFYRVVFSIW